MKRVLNNRGFLVFDVLFVFTLSFFLFVLFMVFSLTLNVVEITQYIAYTGSRNYMAAHHTKEDQISLAERKMNSLQQNSVMGPFFRNWFELEEPEIGGKSLEDFPYVTGVEIDLNAKVMNFRIPFLNPTEEGEEGGFQTQVRSFLGRETSQGECQLFNQRRLDFIKQKMGFNFPFTSQEPLSYSDNGC